MLIIFVGFNKIERERFIEGRRIITEKQIYSNINLEIRTIYTLMTL